VYTLRWQDNKLYLLDQTKLPVEHVDIECSTYEEVADAIKNMKVRGAPAIGVTAAYGIVLGAMEYVGDKGEPFFSHMEEVSRVLAGTRPTAVNLFWAIERMMSIVRDNMDKSLDEIRRLLLDEAHKIKYEDIEANKKMGRFGQELLKDGDTILTHCNAGALATAGYGTALGVIRAAVEAGKDIKVYADETRPYLQGARLTAWELMEDGIPVTLITDNMAGYFMRKGAITGVIVGADRIAANGDVANKIGTYTVAVLAKENNIPFYVAAPTSTFDLALESGEKIPIEERDPREVTHIQGKRIAPYDVKVKNPAFDVTPNRYVTAIITEKGVAHPPYGSSLKELVLKAQ